MICMGLVENSAEGNQEPVLYFECNHTRFISPLIVSNRSRGK